MKSGAGSPFEDDFNEDDAIDESEPVETEPEETTAESQTTNTSETTAETLPYKYRRDGVQDDRSHANLFLRDEAETHVENVVNAMEETFESESVYKIDVLEAIVLAANDDSRTVESELRKMGYGMK